MAKKKTYTPEEFRKIVATPGSGSSTLRPAAREYTPEEFSRIGTPAVRTIPAPQAPAVPAANMASRSQAQGVDKIGKLLGSGSKQNKSTSERMQELGTYAGKTVSGTQKYSGDRISDLLQPAKFTVSRNTRTESAEEPANAIKTSKADSFVNARSTTRLDDLIKPVKSSPVNAAGQKAGDVFAQQRNVTDPARLRTTEELGQAAKGVQAGQAAGTTEPETKTKAREIRAGIKPLNDRIQPMEDATGFSMGRIKSRFPAAQGTEANEIQGGKKEKGSWIPEMTAKDAAVLQRAKDTPASWADPESAIEEYFTARKYGSYDLNEGLDPRYYSREGLKKEIALTEQQLAGEQKKEGLYQANDPEYMAELEQRVKDTEEQRWKYTMLGTKGLPKNPDQQIYAGGEEYYTARPEDYYEGNNREDYDRMFYDFLYGTGAYSAAIDAIETDEDVDALEAELDRMWDTLETGGFEKIAYTVQQPYQEAKSESMGVFRTNALERRLDTLRKYEVNQATIRGLEEEATGSGEYDPSLVRVMHTGESLGTKLEVFDLKTEQWVKAGDIDQIYFAINNPDTYVGADPGAFFDKDLTDWALRDEKYFMTPEMVETFNKLYLDPLNGKAKAQAYYDALLPYLRELKTGYNLHMTGKLTEDRPVLMVTERLMQKPGVGFQGTVNAIRVLLGDQSEELYDKFSGIYLPELQSQTISNTNAEKWGRGIARLFGEDENGFAYKFGKWLHGGVESIADNITAMVYAGMLTGNFAGAGASGAAAKAAEWLVLLTMSMEAAGTTFTNKVVYENRDPFEASMSGIASGIIELISEKVSLDRLYKGNFKAALGNWRAMAKEAAAMAGIEGSEEIAAGALGIVENYVTSELFEHENEIQEATKRIMEEEGIPENEALAKAWWQKVDETLQEGAAGALSGLGMSLFQLGGGTIQAHAQNQEIGNRALMSVNNTDLMSVNSPELMTDAAATAEASERSAQQQMMNQMELISAAEQMNEGTYSKELANRLRNKLRDGKKVSAAEFGKLVRSIKAESDIQIGNIAEETLRQRIYSELQETNTPNAERLSEIAAKKAMGERLNLSERQALKGNEVASLLSDMYSINLPEVRTAEELKTAMSLRADVKEEIRNRTEGIRQVQDAVMDMVKEPGTVNSSVATEAVSEVMKDAKPMTAEEIEDVEGERIGSAAEVVVDGAYAEIEGFHIEEEENSETKKKEQNVMVDLADGRTVNINEVRATTQGMADVLEYIRTDKLSNVGENLANALIVHAAQSDNAAEVVAQGLKIVYSELLGTKAVKTNLSSEAEADIRKAVTEDAQEADRQQLAMYRKINPGRGQVSFNGKLAGTKAFAQELKTLPKQAREEAQAIAQLSKYAGIDTNLFYDPNDKTHGSYQSGRGVTINLAAKVQDGVYQGALSTWAHEVTHNIASNSAQAYRALRSFVLQAQEQYGMKNVRDTLQNLIDSYEEGGVHLNIHEAVAELVAKSAESILLDERVVQKLRESDPALHNSIKGITQKFVSRIRNALNRIGMGASIYSTPYRAIRKLGDQLTNLWIGTYEEAKAAERTTGETVSRVQNSISDNATIEQKVQYSLAGIQANAGYAFDVRMAVEMDADGATAEDILLETGCLKGYDGRYWRVLDNGNMHLTVPVSEIEENRDYMQEEIYDAEELYAAYPTLRRVSVRFQDLGMRTLGQQTGTSIVINSRVLMKGNEFIEDILQHENQHVIQRIERSNQGANTNFWKDVQDVSRARMVNADQEITQILANYDIDYAGDELQFGIEFNEDGSVNTEWLDENVKPKVEKITEEDLQAIRSYTETFERNANYLRQSAEELYQNTVGEIEARAAARRGNEQYEQMDYSRAVAIEKVQYSIQELDEQYAQAVENEDWETAENMLLEKMQRTEGIVGYKAPHFYAGEHQDIAKMIKSGNREVIRSIAEDMARNIPENAVLIPMPPHQGKVLDNTDTMILANEISRITGAPVINALESDPHESRFKAKSQGNRSVTADSMGFRQVAEIPDGTMPVFIDNMVGGGTTATAAHNAIGRGITLAYAQSSRAKSQGVKSLSVTYDKKGKLIPLSQRMDPNNRSWKYSMRSTDEQYHKAVARGDMDQAANYIIEAAHNAGYTDTVYHGTDSFGYTSFDMAGSQDEIFVSYDRDLAGTYTRNADVREVKDNEGFIDFSSMSDDALINYLYSINDDDNSYNAFFGMNNVTVNDNGKFILEYTDADGDYVLEESKQSVINDLRKYNSYQNNTQGIYELFANPGRQLVVDAQGEHWNSIWFEPLVNEFYNRTGSYEEEPSGFKTREIADWARRNGYDSVRINNVFDDGGRSEIPRISIGDIGVFFNPNMVKSADTVVEDDNGDIILPSERFNKSEQDIRYSIQAGDQIRSENGKVLADVLEGGTIAKHSLRSWDEDNQQTILKNLMNAGYSKVQALKWIHDVDSIAAIIANDRERLDYIPDRTKRFKKPNADVYKYTLDASTLCAKRILYQGTFNEIQKLLPNTPLKPGDLIELANMMHDMGFQTPCGICYVESRRRHTGNAAEQWLKNYTGEYIPNYAELTTTDGLATLKKNHPKAYNDFIRAMNRRGSGSVKLVQTRTDYRKDLRRMSKEMVEYLNSVGGIRIQSFSDFETPHLIDMMQAVLDMTAKGLKSQGYTKVPNFAWVFGDTGIKINLSLMGEGTGLNSKGELIFSSTEGMDIDEAMDLRNRYSKNVGTILVGMNEAHIIAAMGDSRIDFIIPFHKSGWSAEEFAKMKTLQNYDDFEAFQNEKRIVKINEDGTYETQSLDKGERNIMPEEYWQSDKNGTQNSEIYLQLCKERGLQPKFSNFLEYKGNGKFALPSDNSERSKNIRNGYWKTLIDFKMYDNDGNFAPQEVVKPNINMQEAWRVLKEYEGGANTLPVAQPVVDRYVQWYKNQHPERTQFSMQDVEDQNAQLWAETVPESALRTDAERTLVEEYRNTRMRERLQRERERELQGKIRELETVPEENRSEDVKRQIRALNTRMENARNKKEAAQQKLAEITSSQGYVGMMYRQQMLFSDFLQGKSQAEVQDATRKLEESVGRITEAIRENQRKVEELAKTDAMQRVREILQSTTRDQAVDELKKKYHSTWSKKQLQPFMEEILVKMAAGEDFTGAVEQLAEILIESDSTKTYEGLAELRGLTLTIGKGAQKEMRAKHETLASYREKLAGTGIKLKTGDRTSLEADEDDLRARYPGMPEIRSDLDALDQFVEWVNGLRGREEDEFYEEYKAQAMADVMEKAAGAMANGRMYIPKDAKAKAQILELVETVQAMGQQTQEAQDMLRRVSAELEELQKAGARASGMASAVTRDMNAAVDYYNRTAKLAQDTKRAEQRKDLIAQLKSENAERIAKNNEQWRELLERDRNARKQADRNMQARSMINTVVNRMYRLLKAPKGTNNIPEHMQGLARSIIDSIVTNDLLSRKISLIPAKQLAEMKRVLNAWTARDGEFSIADAMEGESMQDAFVILNQDILAIDRGIEEYKEEINGKNRLDTLEKRGQILRSIQEAVSEIYGFIQAERSINVNGKRMAIQEAANRVTEGLMGRKYREKTGKIGRALATLHKGIVSGNMTPEYYFRMLGNDGLNLIWSEYHNAENRNGLELARAKARLAEIAEEHGYNTWDLKKKYTVKTHNGNVQLNLGQLMSLWATWNREQKLGPEMSEHLTKGGFYAEEQDLREGLLGHAEISKRAHRVDEFVMQDVADMLTEEQKAFVQDVVGFLSNDMSELGNAASMAAYGIKMYKEEYYFPFQIWDGVKSRKSNEGAGAANQDRAFHPSFSKSRMHGANNALIIGEFMQTAADHIAGMINYATMGLANENLNKVLNSQVTDYDDEGVNSRRNVRAWMEEAYGQTALNYLLELQRQLNGGAVKTQRDFYDKAISLFRKNAVAGSLSVALQQPLSYLRAATMINPKYLVKALNPAVWKGSLKEMMEHSGVAVIKDMGRFDMNFGQSAREYLMPDGKESTGRKIWNGIVDTSTVLPELMDRMTWTRMWSAVKAEQMDAHPDMDTKSEEFLKLVGDRFNELMRRTQVYDSVLVKSANMRSDSKWLKGITSFMAEPTLTLNVLADSVRSAVQKEAGGKALVGKAAATFVLSAVLQAVVKAIMGSGRSPDEKKTWLENFLYKWFNSFMSEVDPLQLIPGFSEVIQLLKNEKIEDDALGVIGKVIDAGKSGIDMLLGNKGVTYRNIEDTVGQLVQAFSGVPMKNLMRDARAMWNWAVDQPYADRASNWGVIKYQMKDAISNADNLLGVVNKWLGDAGWETKNTAYYEMIYEAKRDGREQEAQNMIDYLLHGRGVKEESIRTGIASAAKKDENASAEETARFLTGEGKDATDYIREQLRSGTLTAEGARKLLQENDPEKDADSIWWTVDRIQWELETGEKGVSGTYYRLKAAIEENKSEKITAAMKTMTAHGVKAKNIRTWLANAYKAAYLEATGSERRRLKDALTKAYKATGLTEEEAIKTIDSWKKK